MFRHPTNHNSNFSKSDPMSNGREYDRSAVYEIVVRGKLDPLWSRWFAVLQIWQR
jgi:hypothetical protein